MSEDGDGDSIDRVLKDTIEDLRKLARDAKDGDEQREYYELLLRAVELSRSENGKGRKGSRFKV